MPRLYNYEKKSYEEIPDEFVREKVLSREYGFSVEDKVPVIAPNGTRYMLPGDKAYEAFQHGGNYGTTADWERIGRKEEYGEGWENYLGAGLAGAGRGATLGLSDPILRTIFGKDRMQTWREELPGVSIGTEIGGAIIPALFSGGGTTAVSGTQLTAKGANLARKAFTAGDVVIPAKGLFKAGRMLEDSLAGTRLLSRGADKGLAVKILSESMPKGVAGALEASAFGAGTTLTEVMLGDPHDVTELLLSNVGLSALFGGLAGAGLNAALIGGAVGTKGLGKGFASLHQKVTDSALSVAAEAKLAKLAGGRFGNSNAETLIDQIGWTTRARKSREAASKLQKTFGQRADEVTSGLNSIIDDMAAITDASRSAGKHHAVRDTVFGVTGQFTKDRAVSAPKNAMVAVRDMLLKRADDVDAFYAGSGLDAFEWFGRAAKRAKHSIASDGLEDILGPGLWSKDGAVRKKAINDWFDLVRNLNGDSGVWRELGTDAFLMLDDFKKFTGNYASFGGRAVADPALAMQIKGMNEAIAELLTKGELWGKAAGIQAKINPLYSNFLIAQARLRDAGLSGKLTGKQLEAFLEAAAGDKNMLGAFKDYLNAAKKFSKSIGDEYNFAGWEAISGDLAGVKGLYQKAAAATKRIPGYDTSVLGKASKLAEEVSSHKALFGITGLDAFSTTVAEDVTKKMVGNLGKQIINRKLIGGAGGAYLGGPLGAAGGVLLGGIMDGAATARQLSHIENATRTAKNHLNKSLDSVIKKMTKGGPNGAIPPRPNRTKLFLAPLSAQFGEELSKKKTTRQEDYKVAKERSKKLGEPQALMSMINKVTEAIEHDMPHLAAAIKDRLANGAQVMSAGFNKDSRTMDDMTMGVPERQPTDREIAQQEIRVAVGEDPVNEICKNFEAGTLTATHVDTLKKCYPNLHAMIITGFIDRFSQFNSEGGKPIHFAYRAQASILLERPFDVSYKSENVNMLQSSYGEKSEEGGKIKSTPLLKTHFGKGPTEVEKVMA